MIKEDYAFFETTLAITNISEYGVNPDSYLLNQLGTNFNHRCFMGKYILKVVKIEKRSKCVINSTNLTAYGNIDIRFMAKILCVSPGDILANVTITTNNITYIGNYDYLFTDAETKKITKETVATAIRQPSKKDFKIGWTLPIVLLEVEYSPMSRAISTYGTLLCAPYFVETKKTWRIDKENAILDYNDIIANQLKNIKVELELRTKPDFRPESIMFFEKLFYPMRSTAKTNTKWETYEGGQPWIGPPSMNFAKPLLSIVNAVNLVSEGKEQIFSGVWTRPLELHRSSPMIQKLDADMASAAESTLVETTANVMIAEVLTEILDNLRFIRMMVINYNDEKIKSQDGLWKIIEDLKL
jgi:hypothetical protein